jgi:diaminopimelate decarboxylase
MSDNPRVALYGAKFSVALADRHPLGPIKPVTVVGRHCEAGDELAFAAIGAYHRSMASSHNAAGRPPVLAVRHGRKSGAVRRETFADLWSRDRGAPGARCVSSHQSGTSGYDALLHGEYRRMTDLPHHADF